MIYLIDTIKHLLGDLPVFDSDATEATGYPYVLILGATPSRGSEEDVAVVSSQSSIIVRAVGISAEHARAVLMRTRGRLRGQSGSSNGYLWSFQWDGAPRPTQIERLVRAGETDTNVAFIDDEYTVYGEPISPVKNLKDKE